MTDIVCDASSIISLATNCLLWLLPSLRERMEGNFIIPPSVRRELIDKPLKSTRYRFEAIRVVRALEQGDIVIPEDPELKTRVAVDAEQLLSWGNSIFAIGRPRKGRSGRYAKIFHLGEAEAVAMTRHMETNVLLIDEKTTRFLIEDPQELVRIIERRTKAKVYVNDHSLQQFMTYTKDIQIIRSAELALAAYEAGLFRAFRSDGIDQERHIVSGVLHAIRNSGCAIGSSEIDDYVSLEFGEVRADEE